MLAGYFEAFTTLSAGGGTEEVLVRPRIGRVCTHNRGTGASHGNNTRVGGGAGHCDNHGAAVPGAGEHKHSFPIHS